MQIIGCALMLLAMMVISVPAKGEDSPSCNVWNQPYLQGQPLVKKVAESGRLYLLSDKDGCPNNQLKCRQGYLVMGDEVLAGRGFGSFTCVSYVGRLGASVGWVDTSRLNPTTDGLFASLQSWVGTWRDGDNVIEIKKDGDKLVAGGAAYWPQPTANPKITASGGFNFGTFDGAAIPNGSQVRFEQGDSPADMCVVTAKKIGRFVVVRDNKNCGGMNVTFDGLYRQK